MMERLEGRALLSASTVDVEDDHLIVHRPTPVAFDDTAEGTSGSGQGAAGYQIQVVFPDGSLTPTQQAVFTTAAAKWQSIIMGELSDVTADFDNDGFNETVDDLRITATAPSIDGVGGILGQAGPEFIRSSNDLTITGVMQFDSADVANLQAQGTFDEVILHEMGHVIGLGTLWGPMERNLITGAGGADPRYTGALGNAQYQAIFGLAAGSQVPIENTGGAGTRDGHWRETTFDTELMTGFLDGGAPSNPISVLTIAQFADLGHPSVNINGFEPYTPPGVSNARPTIASLSDLPDPAPTNSSVTLTANSVADSNGTISTVNFYRETNNIPGLQVMIGTVGDIQGDLLLGSDGSSAGGYTFNASTAGLANGAYTYYAQALDNNNLRSLSAQTTHTVGASASATPGTPDLSAAADTGSSSVDNVTRFDNSSAGNALFFFVGNTVPGATVSIYSGGTFIGSAVASGSTTLVTTNGAVDLADGVRSITARQTESGKTESPDSSALSVTIDTLAPTVDVTDVSPDPRLTGVSSVGVVFSQAVTGFDLADLALTRTSVNLPLTASQAPTTANNITFTVPNLTSLTSVSGTYQISVSASGGIADVAGNALLAAASDTWVHSLPSWVGGGSAVTWNSSTLALTVTGAASIIADPGADAPIIAATGAASILSINTPAGGQVSLGGIQLSNSARVNVSATGAARVLSVANGVNFTLDATATLDLNDNALVIRNANAAAASAKHTSVNNLVRNSFNGFSWNLPGITSTTAQTDVNNGLPSTLGILLNNDGTGNPLFYGNGGDLPQFLGATVDSNTVMIRFTKLGDGDLNGVVDTVDFALFQAGYTNSAPYIGFAFGDYDYNGVVDTVDFGLFQAGYGN